MLRLDFGNLLERIGDFGETLLFGYFGEVGIEHVPLLVLPFGCRQQVFGRSRKLKPLAFNLNLIQQLSELSWLPVDNNVSIAEMEQAFRSIVRTKRFSRWTDLLLVSVGNAAFCRLFNGDLWAMLTVFAATLLGFLVKQQLSRLKYNPLGVIILSAFAASMAAACAVIFQLGSTPQIALATSVLFLVPGVQMINSIMDLMHGHILMGISRGVHSIMMISCITIGLSATMLIVGVNSL